MNFTLLMVENSPDVGISGTEMSEVPLAAKNARIVIADTNSRMSGQGNVLEKWQ